MRGEVCVRHDTTLTDTMLGCLNGDTVPSSVYISMTHRFISPDCLALWETPAAVMQSCRWKTMIPQQIRYLREIARERHTNGYDAANIQGVMKVQKNN